MRRQPRVSVIVPAYNRAHYIKTALDSVLAQHFTDFELIVVDDASTDDTAAVVRGYADSRIRLTTNATNLGIAGSRNRGLDLARGEYVAALDSDDYAYPQRLARQVAFLDRHPAYAVIGSWTSWMDGQGRMSKRVRRRPTNADDAAAMLIFNSCLAQPSVTGRTAILREYRYNEDFDLSSDYELWARMAGHCKMASLPAVLVCCRHHRERTTRADRPRVLNRQSAVHRYQLDALGMDYTDDDLVRHQLLPRSQHKGGPGDIADLEWAEDWLLRLRQANRTRRRYAPRAFDRVLGWVWTVACYRTVRNHGWHTLNRFAQSPLCGAALASVGQQIQLWANSRLTAAAGPRPPWPLAANGRGVL